MNFQIEIVSTEDVKPSSPTPQNLRNFKVSLLDQIIPHFHSQMVLYFPSPDHPDNKNHLEEFISKSTKTLKQSLSKLLTRFYPLAGIVKDNLTIDCNDQGLPFVVAKVKSNLTDFLKKPDSKHTLRLLPCELSWPGTGPEQLAHVALLQVSYFDCGGTAIAFVFTHKLVDGVTLTYFFKTWSQYAYNCYNNINNVASKEVVGPNYIIRSLFPQNEALPAKYYHIYMIKDVKVGKTIMRRYVFDSRAISTLKAQAGDIFRLSRVEVVSAFLWKCFITTLSSLAIHDNKKVINFVQYQSLDMRRKIDPPLPETCFGNLVWIAKTSTTNNEPEECNLESLVRKSREAIRKVDNDYIMRMYGDEGMSGFCKINDELRGNHNKDVDVQEYDRVVEEEFGVTSCCNFGLYKLDFGWGKPIWVNNCSGDNNGEDPYSNSVFLIDTRNGDGVEACVTLEEQCMRAFDDIEELKALASVDPSPFDIA